MEVPTGPGLSFGSRGAGDSAGNVWVTWSTDFPGGQWSVYYNYYDGSQWGIPTRLPNDPLPDHGNYSLTVDKEGRVWAGWWTMALDSDSGVYASYHDTAGWHNPKRIGPLGVGGPVLAADPLGKVWAAWGVNQGNAFNVYASCYVDTVWSAAMLVSSEPYHSDGFRPAMAADSDGNVWLCWDSEQGGNRDIYFSYWDGSTWSTPAPVDTHSASDAQPAVLADDSGRIWVAWRSRRAGYNYIYESHTYGVGIEKSGTPNRTLGFSLDQSRPNPFRQATSMSYSVPIHSHICVRLYDIRGTLIKSLVEEHQEPGKHLALWDGTDNMGRSVPAGVYLYKFDAGAWSATRKTVLVR